MASLNEIRHEEMLHSRKCLKCKTWVPRSEKNNHVKCVCGTELCFLCMHTLLGHKEYDTGKPHFGRGRCSQHGDLIAKPTPVLLNTLGHAKRPTESVAAFSIHTQDAALPPSNDHAEARAEARDVIGGRGGYFPPLIRHSL
eukprot:2971583-Prymnesium_polylepis.1